MSTRIILAIGLVLLMMVSSFCFARIETDNVGRWPDSWPEELEGLREQSKTIYVGHGIQENVYEIGFATREEFEKAWPFILSLKTKGAPLFIDASPSYYDISGSTAKLGVRILSPTRGGVGRPGYRHLDIGPPWPHYIKLASGGLPEYVSYQYGRWIPAGKLDSAEIGFQHRARVDIVLIVDGTIVDLNRIELPANTPIIDRRFIGRDSEKE